MSDDNNNEAWPTNAGITLPDNADATHDANLSPFFISRTGYHYTFDNLHITWRGYTGYLWASTIKTELEPMHLHVWPNVVSPSANNIPVYGFPLRCLVSTNNR